MMKKYQMASTIRNMSKTLPPSRTAPQFVVRFPDENMRDRIAEAAKANNRSMNAEIISRLEKTFSANFIPAPALVRSLDKSGQLQGKNSKELLNELASLIQSASHIANIFQAYQEDELTPDRDVGDPPDWPSITDDNDLQPDKPTPPRQPRIKRPPSKK